MMTILSESLPGLLEMLKLKNILYIVHKYFQKILHNIT